jgi:hypothetical protein
MTYVPYNDHGIIVDAQIMSARGNQALTEEQRKAYEPILNFLRHTERKAAKHHKEFHFWVPDKVVDEAALNGDFTKKTFDFPTGTRRLPITTSKNSAEYKSIQDQLTKIGLGNAKGKDGTADRTIVTEIFFAHTTRGHIPKFATYDTDVVRKLCELSPGCAWSVARGRLFVDYADGFEAALRDSSGQVRKIWVLPIPRPRDIIIPPELKL